MSTVAPLVSILIPCFNAARYIEATLDCVLAQTWPNMEIIVVDDGSSDDSRSKVAQYRDRGVRLIERANKGAAAARNVALANSSGAWIQFLDADDLISSNKLESQVRRLGESRSSVASCQWGRFSGDLSTYSPNPEAVWRDMTAIDWLVESRHDGLGMMFPALWLIPRELAISAGPWNEDLSLSDDTEYFTRLLCHVDQVLFCDDATAYYRSGVAGSLSGRKSKAAWNSSFRVTELCETQLLGREDSERMRRVVALSWRQFAFACYPHDVELANEALRRAARLSSVKMEMPAAGLFGAVAKLVGWKAARRLQHWRHGGRV